MCLWADHRRGRWRERPSPEAHYFPDEQPCDGLSPGEEVPRLQTAPSIGHLVESQSGVDDIGEVSFPERLAPERRAAVADVTPANAPKPPEQPGRAPWTQTHLAKAAKTAVEGKQTARC